MFSKNKPPDMCMNTQGTSVAEMVPFHDKC